MRLISSSLMQVSTELEEARTHSWRKSRPDFRQITLPLIRHGLIASWLLVFMIFEREYSTGVYLLAPGTEVIGAQLVSLWQGGAIESSQHVLVEYVSRPGRGSLLLGPSGSGKHVRAWPAWKPS